MMDDVKPGIYSCVPNDKYHAGPEVSKSGLDLIHKSPFHYWAAKLAPDRPREISSKAKFNGSAVHAAVLEPKVFEREFRCGPDANRNTKEWKAAAEAAPGVNLMKPDEWDLVNRQADAVRTHPLVRELLSKGDPEQSCYWKDGELDVACRARPDWLCLQRGLIVDLKTTRSADPEDFIRSSWDFRYHVQAAWYRAGVTEAARQSGFTGEMPELTFCIVAVESSYPHCVSVFAFKRALIEAGIEEMRQDLDQYALCQHTNSWPSYGTNILSLDIPYWEKKRRA